MYPSRATNVAGVHVRCDGVSPGNRPEGEVAVMILCHHIERICH